MGPNYTETQGTVRKHEGHNITLSYIFKAEHRASLSLLLQMKRYIIKVVLPCQLKF